MLELGRVLWRDGRVYPISFAFVSVGVGATGALIAAPASGSKLVVLTVDGLIETNSTVQITDAGGTGLLPVQNAVSTMAQLAFDFGALGYVAPEATGISIKRTLGGAAAQGFVATYITVPKDS